MAHAPGRSSATWTTLRLVIVVGALLAVLTGLAPPAPATTAPDPAATSGAGRGSQELRARAAEEAGRVDAARHAYLTARTAQVEAEQALARADVELASRRVQLGRWAREAYQSGSEIADNPTLVAVLGGRSDDVAHSRRIMATVGVHRERAVRDTVRALRVRTAAAEAAVRHEQDARALLGASEQARVQRDAAVSAQRATLAGLEARLRATLDEAERVEAEEQRAAQARALAAALAATSSGGVGGNAVTGEVGSCRGGEMDLYGNGQIPLDALCPLWGAPSHRLRADAAFAFDQLSTAYAREFGQPICVTDSYRSYAEQVAVKAAKPALAAVPGTSNHGWGTALDLCGGVQSFGSPQHRWLKLHAPAHAWFHPAWAGQNGSLPEPWHWEFAG